MFVLAEEEKARKEQEEKERLERERVEREERERILAAVRTLFQFDCSWFDLCKCPFLHFVFCKTYEIKE